MSERVVRTVEPIPRGVWGCVYVYGEQECELSARFLIQDGRWRYGACEDHLVVLCREGSPYKMSARGTSERASVGAERFQADDG